MDSIECGDGIDRVVINRRDKVFNCERVTRLRSRTVPGNFAIKLKLRPATTSLDIYLVQPGLRRRPAGTTS